MTLLHRPPLLSRLAAACVLLAAGCLLAAGQPRPAVGQAVAVNPVATTAAELQTLLDTTGIADYTGDITLAAPLVVRQGDAYRGGAPSVRLRGVGPSARILCPPTVARAIQIEKATWGSQFENVYIQRTAPAGDDLSQIGIAIGFDASVPGAGAITGSHRFSDVTVSGFGIGVSCGDPVGQTDSSECTFDRIKLTGCHYGFVMDGTGNAISHKITMPAVMQCKVAFRVIRGCNLTVLGGSISQCGGPDPVMGGYEVGAIMAGWGGVNAVRDVRFEGLTGPAVLVNAGTANTTVTVDGCYLGGCHPASGHAFRTQYGGVLIVRGCRADSGMVWIDAGNEISRGGVTIEDSVFNDPRGPLGWNATAANRFHLRNVGRYDPATGSDSLPLGGAVSATGTTLDVAGSKSLARAAHKSSVAGRVITTEVLALDGWGVERTDGPAVAVSYTRGGGEIAGAVTRPDPVGRPGRYVATATLPRRWLSGPPVVAKVTVTPPE